jgi:acetyltransferase-like isoleucine patch superfamily enzyme
MARVRARGRLVIGGRVRLGRGVVFDLAPGAFVVLEDRCSIGDGCRFHVAGGRVRIGEGAALGARCVLAAHDSIEVGAGAALGDEVVLIDFDHDVRDTERPVRLQGLVTAPVRVGRGAVVGAAAAVLPGATVAEGARVLPRSVVTDLPPPAE